MSEEKDVLKDLLMNCSNDYNEKCIEVIDRFLEEVKEKISVKVKVKIDVRERYKWVEKIIDKGLPDGRKRFILKVLTPYLVNVLSLSDEEAFEKLKEFIDNSCKNFNNCEKIYDSWLRGDIKRVRSKGLKPSKLDNLDEDLKEIIRKIIS